MTFSFDLSALSWEELEYLRSRTSREIDRLMKNCNCLFNCGDCYCAQTCLFFVKMKQAISMQIAIKECKL